MRDFLIKGGYIPLDKSWMIRMGILDLVAGFDDIIKYLEQHESEVSDDLKALYRTSIQWKENSSIDVGESGTLYRFLKFASWKLKQDKKFITRGTLKDRNISDNPDIVNWSLIDLLSLDNGTSQWASASILMGNSESMKNPPYKLQVTLDAVEHWKSRRALGKSWEPRYDETILAQAIAYIGWIDRKEMNFVPEQAEDYCFSRAFGIVTTEFGEKTWPSFKGHESDRIQEMDIALQQKEVTSKDHRVVQAIAMLKGNEVLIKYLDSVNKSWPQFWKFLEDSKSFSFCEV